MGGGGRAFFKQLVTRYHVVQVGLKLLLFLVKPPECWVYKYVPSYPALKLMINPVKLGYVQF